MGASLSSSQSPPILFRARLRAFVSISRVILMGFCCLVMSGLGLVAGSGSSLFSAAGVVV